jgi:hypothetical protein
MKNILKKTVITLSFISLIMVGFSSVGFAEPRPFEEGTVSSCGMNHHVLNEQQKDEIRVGLVDGTYTKSISCGVAMPSDNAQLISEDRFGGR